MYPEFIIIYIGMAVLALLSIATLILLIRLLKNNDHAAPGSSERYTNKQVNYRTTNAKEGIVFCKNCGTRFDGVTRVCPKCGTPR